MANTDPVADTAGVVEQIWRLGRQAGHCDVQPVGAVTVGSAGRAWPNWARWPSPPARVRVFSDDGRCVSDAVLMRRALEYVKAFDGVIAQHAQEPRLTEGAQLNEGEMSGRLGLTGWPAVAEEAVIARDCLLTAHVGSALHVCHVSTAGSVEIIRWAKSKGWRVTAEVTPHHLLLTDYLAASYDPVYKVNPPLRTAADVAALREGLADGTIDCVATDHAPHPLEDKETEWDTAAFGMTGLETALRVVHEAMVDTGLLDWAGVADRMSRRPAAIGRLPGPERALAGRAAGQPDALRPVGPRHGGPACARLPEPEQPVRGDGAAGPGGGHVPARDAHRPRREARLMAGSAGITGPSGAGAAAILVLEDGTTFRGTAFGADGETFGEMVFNTGMTGYQETLTDPSYARQIVAMTAPHIGNTGVNDEDSESRRIWVSGYVVREPARIASNWRSQRSLDDELRAQGITGIAITGTRALTRHLRDRGAMRAGDRHRHRRRGRAAASGSWPARRWSARTWPARCPRTPPTPWPRRTVSPVRYRVAAVDLGIKTATPRPWPGVAARSPCSRPPAPPAEILAAPPGRRVLLQRARRPGGGWLRGRRGPRRTRPRRPGVRHLPGQPDPGPGARPGHLQAPLRAPRGEPAGQGPGDRAGAHHQPQPRLRGGHAGRPGQTGAGRHVRHRLRPGPDHPRQPQRRRGRGTAAAGPARRSASSTTPRPRRARTTRPGCSTSSAR